MRLAIVDTTDNQSRSCCRLIIFLPSFSGYNVTIDENTPPGLTIYRGIQAIDIDKPNTPNSDIRYSIVSGNKDRKFSIEGNQKAVVVLRKSLDFEKGDSLFNLTILAQVIHSMLNVKN